jgi:hypothetical protein
MKKTSGGFISFISIIFLLFLLFFTQQAYAQDSATIGKWGRYVVSLSNSTYTGNPFELEVDGVFTHTTSGTQIRLPGYYDGNNTWKIGFMPTKTGDWIYATVSNDSDLNGKQGTVNAVESGLPGMLKADAANPNKWKFADGDYVVPMALRMEIFSEPATISEFTAMADFLKNNNIQMAETRLLEETGMFESGRHDFIFEGNWSNHKFDLTVWNRMEERMNILAERGLGAHVMFYSDDAGKPGWAGQSATEKLVIRYAIARLAGYPVVWFNTGIDIAEYRNQSDINWFGQQIRSLDPYGHPVSSRHGGGSGTYVMSGQIFDSQANPPQAKISNMISYFQQSDVPVSMDDAWGENRGSHLDKDHTASDIRRAFWKAAAAGGVGGLIRGGGNGLSYDGYFSVKNVQSDLESEQWLKLINPFIKNKLGATFGQMVPSSSLVNSSGGKYALADPSRTKIFYFLMGKNDTWDSGDGGPITIKLSSLSGNYAAVWYDPRTGTETSAGTLAGGSDHTLTPPSTDDWVLYLTKTASGGEWGMAGKWKMEHIAFVTGYGHMAGPAREAINRTQSAAEATNGDIYFIGGQVEGQDIFVISGGRVNKIAGNGLRGFQDGPAGQAMFNFGGRGYPQYDDIALDSKNNVYVADGFNGRIRKIYKDASGKWQVATVAGGGAKTLVKGESAQATSIRLGNPVAVAVDNQDNIYTVPDYSSIIKISPDGTATSLPVSFVCPETFKKCQTNIIKMDADKAGNVYLLGRGSGGTYWKLTKEGQLIALNGGDFHDPNRVWDGPQELATFWGPWAIATDSSGEKLYGGGGDESRIRRFYQGRVSTLQENGEWAEVNSWKDGWDLGKVLTVSKDGSLILAETGEKWTNIRRLTFLGE